MRGAGAQCVWRCREVQRKGDRVKMKAQIVFLSCICTALAITVHYETSLSKDGNENGSTLKDIRLVPVGGESLRRPMVVDEPESVQRTRGNVKGDRQSPRTKSRGEKRKPALERVGTAKQTVPVDPNHQLYMQKVANQLFTAQKHASVLSDYQKFILNQDPNVKKFVLGHSVQERTPKPFSRTRQVGRSLSAVPTQEPTAAANGPFQKIVVVTPKIQTTARKNFRQPTDHSAQATHLKYVTLAPHFVPSHESPQRVTLFPYHTPQPYNYYELAPTGKPEAAQIPSTLSAGLGAFESPLYHKGETGHEAGIHHENTKYEFMYKVKDHDKNNNFGHKESRTDKTTYGYYYVRLPDGRLETVKYWADKTGYHAKVDYEGEAKHPPHPERNHHSHNFLHR